MSNLRHADHDNVAALLPYYVADTLSSTDRLFVEAHLSDCMDCTHALTDWQRISAEVIAGAQRSTTLPPLLDRLPIKRRRQSEHVPGLHVRTRTLYAAAALLIVLLGVAFISVVPLTPLIAQYGAANPPQR